MQFGRIEIREPDFDPGRRIGAGTDAQAVAVADVPDDAGKGLAGAIGQTARARIGLGGRRTQQKGEGDQEPFHGPSLPWGQGGFNPARRERKAGGGRSVVERKDTAMIPTPHSAPDPRRRGAARPAPSIPMLAYESLDDQALLAMVLSRSGGEPDRLAGELLARFGSLGAVAAADLSELTRASDAGPAAFADLKVLRELAVRLARVDACRRPAIASWTALQAYVRTAMAHRPREQFRVLYLDHRNNLLRDEWVAEGTVDHAPVYPREVVRRALELSASAMILVHNHPSGDPSPSRADIEMTRQVVDAARVFSLQVHDHLVIGRDGTASFKALGLI